jgi:hypothetical protein
MTKLTDSTDADVEKYCQWDFSSRSHKQFFLNIISLDQLILCIVIQQ